jgi:hypothetical protein
MVQPGNYSFRTGHGDKLFLARITGRFHSHLKIKTIELSKEYFRTLILRMKHCVPLYRFHGKRYEEQNYRSKLPPTGITNI